MVKINSDSVLFNDIVSIFLKNFFSEPPIILCIGSEKATGDALAPLVGSLLRDTYNINTYVYGTLDNSVNAKNIEEVYSFIKNKHQNKKILAIDACVGKVHEINFVRFLNTGVIPSRAVNKNADLSYGDYSILGIVDQTDSDPFKVFTTRLSTVFKMAKKIAFALNYGFKQSFENCPTQALAR